MRAKTSLEISGRMVVVMLMVVESGALAVGREMERRGSGFDFEAEGLGVEGLGVEAVGGDREGEEVTGPAIEA